jgi:Tfp pilus assembly protein PilF
MAQAALSAQDGATAEQYLTRAVARDRSSFDAHALLAQLYVIRGDLERARKTFESRAAHDPQSADARTAVGILLQAAGRDKEARGWVRAGARRSSASGDCRQQPRASVRDRPVQPRRRCASRAARGGEAPERAPGAGNG